ncbi:phasin family protein [Paraburkholderia sp. MMS20-SJTR3]|uniref:Phasin family protein n=1 Tax=Paraburkholderia sejongensis TaxID=2886946 RepID=A0ABS8K5D8_9BURK|nr:phasin family protein [Paraburkholderia sp. MMS20-SJTR3]MCC8397373.1 phasin family protein [Paraburkholderia sp. MMS20-SJTR3]
MSEKESDLNPFAGLTKLLDQFNVPGLDMGPIIDARRKDVDALVAANRTAYESMQTVARKQTEILTQIMQGIQDSFTVAATDSGIAPDLGARVEQAHSVYKKALADMVELSESARKSQVEAMTGIAHRATESLQEMKSLLRVK